MRCAIIPPEKLSVFDVSIASNIRVGPVPIYSGPRAGSYAVNEAILDSCPEWRAVADAALALVAEHGVPIEEIDPSDLRNPEQPV